jgi:hypothetical protein
VSGDTNQTGAVKRRNILACKSGWFPVHEMSPD